MRPYAPPEPVHRLDLLPAALLARLPARVLEFLVSRARGRGRDRANALPWLDVLAAHGYQHHYDVDLDATISLSSEYTETTFTSSARISPVRFASPATPRISPIRPISPVRHPASPRASSPVPGLPPWLGRGINLNLSDVALPGWLWESTTPPPRPLDLSWVSSSSLNSPTPSLLTSVSSLAPELDWSFRSLISPPPADPLAPLRQLIDDFLLDDPVLPPTPPEPPDALDFYLRDFARDLEDLVILDPPAPLEYIMIHPLPGLAVPAVSHFPPPEPEPPDPPPPPSPEWFFDQDRPRAVSPLRDLLSGPPAPPSPEDSQDSADDQDEDDDADDGNDDGSFDPLGPRQCTITMNLPTFTLGSLQGWTFPSNIGKAAQGRGVKINLDRNYHNFTRTNHNMLPIVHSLIQSGVLEPGPAT